MERLALSPREAARVLGISRRHIHAAVRSGELAHQFGVGSRIWAADLERWFKASPLTKQNEESNG